MKTLPNQTASESAPSKSNFNPASSQVQEVKHPVVSILKPRNGAALKMLRDAASEKARALSALQSLDPTCDREAWVRYAMSAKAAGLDFDDFHQWSSGGGNYKSEADCRIVWNSIKDTGITAASLFQAALASGWRDDAVTPRHSTHSKQVRTYAAPTREPHIAATLPNNSVSGFWNRCVPATSDHPYIIAKRGQPDGLRAVKADNTASIAGQSVASWLVVPALSLDGELRTMQLIPPPGVGEKLNLPSASFDDGMFVVGELAQSQRIFIVEGIGHAWACWSATGHAAVVCFGAGRMAKVAELLRKRFATVPLVLVADKGKEMQAAGIARTVRGQWVELPEDKPANYDVNDYAADHGADALAVLLGQAKEPERRFRVLAADDLLNAPPLRWFVLGVIPAQGLACIYGPSGSGKSFLALDMCASVANGVDWFDCRVTRAPVVYIVLEGEHGFRQRVNAWKLHHGGDVPKGLRFVLQPFDLRNADDLAELADAVTASGGAGGLLVIDTLSRASRGADENSSKDMGELIDAAKELQAQLGGTVLLIHHSGKDVTKGLRGHSSLFAALDAAIEVSRNSDRREWLIAKSKDSQDGDAQSFNLRTIELGRDSHGDQESSCVVVRDASAVAIRRVKLPQGGNQKLVWEALGPLFMVGVFGKAGAPPQRPCIKLDVAIAAASGRLTCPADRRTERTRDAITGLVARGLLGCNEGWIWVI